MKIKNDFSNGISLGLSIRIEPTLTPKPKQKNTETMKKQYIQPNISSSQMVCIQSVICISIGENITKTTFVGGNSNPTDFRQSGIEIGTKERNDWGNIGGDDMTYGSIW